MKKRAAFTLILVAVLTMSVLGGCKKGDDKPDISAEPITGTGDQTVTPTKEPAGDPTDTPAATATPDVTAQPTDEPTSTPEPTPELVGIPSDKLTDPEASSWLEITTPEGVRAANLYDMFIKGGVKVKADSDDLMYLPRGEYDLKELTYRMSAELQDNLLPGVVIDAKYGILDCGADHYPEMALEFTFSDPEGYDQATEYVIIKSVNDELTVLDTFQSYYRGYTLINRFGHVESGGSSGASSSEYESRFINAEGRTVVDFIRNYFLSLEKPVIPDYVLTSEMSATLASFGGGTDGEGDYSLEIWSVNPMSSYSASSSDYETARREYLQNAVFIFTDDSGRCIMPEDKYVKACEDLGLHITADPDVHDNMVSENRKKLGITDILFEGDDPEWIRIDGLADQNATGNSGTGNAEADHPYSDFLGTWYIMRGEVDGSDWEASEDLVIQYITFNEDHTVTRRRDYSLDDYYEYTGTCEYFVDQEGHGTVSVDYDDEDDNGEYDFSINSDGVLIEDGIVYYDETIPVGTYVEYERRPFWGDGGYYYEVTAPVTPDVIKNYIAAAKDDQWLVVLVDPDEEIKKACDEGHWEVHDETGNEWIECDWNNATEVIIANSSNRSVELEVHEPRSDYDPKSSDTDWVAGPFFYWADLKPGELTRMIVDLPESPRDATMCLYMKFEGDDTEYLMRLYRYNSSYFKFK